jgi:hypothetical protein
MPRLRMDGILLLLPYMPSWRKEEQFYLNISRIKWEKCS